MEMISQTIQSLTILEWVLLATVVSLAIILWFKYTLVDTLNLRVNDLQVMNNRFYSMYMAETTNSMEIVARWQKCIEENRTLIQQVYSPKNPQ